MTRRSLLPILVALVAWTLRPTPAWSAPVESPGKVYVVLWFDTEDYILPESDDAAKRVAELLTRQGVRATFKVVGEKARTLERRGRGDVIAALVRHEIGYHSNVHSQHPTPAEYEANLDWATGALEFDFRERPGYDDVRRIFGQAPTCYGQPGSSWAPQAYAALAQWGVKVYLDEGSHVGLEGRPFWYGGLLNIFNTQEGSTLHPNPDWSNIAEARARFQEIHRRMTGTAEGGVVSLYFHPCEFIHREFWDGVNFAGGANPPREDWKLPPTKTKEEKERAFQYLEDLVAYMKSLPGTEFVTASETLRIFADGAQGRVYTEADLARIAERATGGGLLPGPSRLHPDRERGRSPCSTGTLRGSSAAPRRKPFGSRGRPTAPPPPSWAGTSLLGRSLEPVLAHGDGRGGPPGTPPADAERDLVRQRGRLARELPRGARPGEPRPAREARSAGVGSPRPGPPGRGKVRRRRFAGLWGWVIFPPGFRAPKLMGLARLQAWTLKPARPHAPSP